MKKRFLARLSSAALLALVSLPAACGDAEPPRQINEEDIPPAARDSLSMADLGGLEVTEILLTIPWTSGSVDRPGQEGAGRAGATRFALTQEDGFDRLLLEFSDEGEFPGYRVEYVDDPRLCTTSARTVAQGRRHIVVAVGPVRSREPDGSLNFDPALSAELPFANVQGIEVTCTENNRLDWAVGLSREQPFRVLELRGPRRLVVDVAHPPS